MFPQESQPNAAHSSIRPITLSRAGPAGMMCLALNREPGIMCIDTSLGWLSPSRRLPDQQGGHQWHVSKTNLSAHHP
ncbi:hypothetical protein HEAR1531 [Herminiimonas arsenicoxydans]|uniref:Uncharacterized protein n=1 Tax=Herminiimonas arsenicoxydans TaxID=204773 RepID=A4G5A9_HERAR|nr:hypothetical protein HEAR1531 [Herminiimonas arsenicoxydans]